MNSKSHIHYINGPREDAGIPRPGISLIKSQVAVVITDPQNDFLSPKGVARGVVGQSVTENNTVANIESLFRALKMRRPASLHQPALLLQARTPVEIRGCSRTSGAQKIPLRSSTPSTNSTKTKPHKGKHMKIMTRQIASALFLLSAAFSPTYAAEGQAVTNAQSTMHKTIKVDGLDIFYREAGPADAPVLLLLHGFPTSSHMFRNLIPALSDRYHVIAPDYPGYGQSSMPSITDFNYTFDSLANIVEAFTEKLSVTRYSLYLMDYGAPVGFRLAAKHPERVQSLIIQNGNAYDEGLREFWVPFKAYWKDRSEKNAEALRKLLTIDGTKWQYTHGTRQVESISPDNWLVDQTQLDRPGNKEIQMALFASYGSNPPLYPKWQEYFRKHQPPTLIVWGKNDIIFPADGAEPYRRDLNNLELHLIDTGHFALEEEGGKISTLIRGFLAKQNF